MGAGYNNLRRENKTQQCKVGREEEGSSSNRPGLAAFLLALRDTLIEEQLLYLCDLILIAFITGNSSLEPLIDGLWATSHC